MPTARITLFFFLTALGAWLAGWLILPHLGMMPVMDEPLYIELGWRTSRGMMPYRDFFDMVTPGIFYLVAGVIKSTGSLNLHALRGVILLFWLGCLGLTLAMGKRYLPTRWLWVLGLFLWSNLLLPQGLLQVNHHMVSTFFGLLAVYCLCHALKQEDGYPTGASKSNTPPGVWLAGLSVGVCLVFTQTLGALLIMTLFIYHVAYLVFGKHQTPGGAFRQGLTCFLAPALLPWLGFSIYFVTQHALGDFIYSTLGWLVEGGYGKTTSGHYLYDVFLDLPGLLQQLGEGHVTQNLFWLAFFSLTHSLCLIMLPLIGIAGPLFYLLPNLFKKRSEDFWQLLLLWAGAAAFMLASLSNASSFLVSQHACLPALLGVVVLQRLIQRQAPKLQAIFSAGFLCLLLAGGLVIPWFLKIGMSNRPKLISYGTDERALNANVAANNSPVMIQAQNTVLRFLHAQLKPGEPFFVFSHSPQLYFLSNHPNPTRYSFIMALYNTPGQIAETVETLAKTKPRFIIYDHEDQRFFQTDDRAQNKRHYDYHLHPLEQWLQAHYTPIFSTGPYVVFKYVSI